MRTRFFVTQVYDQVELLLRSSSFWVFRRSGIACINASSTNFVILTTFFTFLFTVFQCFSNFIASMTKSSHVITPQTSFEDVQKVNNLKKIFSQHNYLHIDLITWRKIFWVILGSMRRYGNRHFKSVDWRMV